MAGRKSAIARQVSCVLANRLNLTQYAVQWAAQLNGSKMAAAKPCYVGYYIGLLSVAWHSELVCCMWCGLGIPVKI